MRRIFLARIQTNEELKREKVAKGGRCSQRQRQDREAAAGA